LLPLLIYFEFEFSILMNPYLNLINSTIIGFLMISKIPTISIKNINFKNKYNPWILLLLIIICIGLVSKLWLTLIILFILYINSIFYIIYKNRMVS
jgi:hypothetical protein